MRNNSDFWEVLKGLVYFFAITMGLWVVVRFFVCMAEPNVIEVKEGINRIKISKRHVFTSDTVLELKFMRDPNCPENGANWMVGSSNCWVPYFRDDQ